MKLTLGLIVLNNSGLVSVSWHRPGTYRPRGST